MSVFAGIERAAFAKQFSEQSAHVRAVEQVQLSGEPTPGERQVERPYVSYRAAVSDDDDMLHPRRRAEFRRHAGDVGALGREPGFPRPRLVFRYPFGALSGVVEKLSLLAPEVVLSPLAERRLETL